MTLTPQGHVARMAAYELAEASEGPMIHLASNEAAIRPSERAIAAAREALADPQLYPDADAGALRRALAETHGIEADRIVCTAGSMEVILYLALAYLGAGTESLTCRYGYLYFDTVARIAGATPVRSREAGLAAEVGALLDAATPRTRIVFLANPNNPTGTMLERAAIAELESRLPDNVLLVLDAAYGEFVDGAGYDDGLELARRSSRTIVLHTFSKIYGLAGMRIGWAYGAPDVVGVLNRIRLPNGLTQPSIAAATAAVGDRGHVERYRALNKRLREHFVARTRAMGLEPVPGHGNFILLRFPGGADQAAAVYQDLKREGVLLRPMGGYGLADCLRATMGAEADLVTAIEKLDLVVRCSPG